MSVVRRVGLLVTLWLLAWGDLSVANVVTGLLLAVGLLVALPPPGRTGVSVHPLGLIRLIAYLLGQLVPSNVLVSREIFRRRSQARSGVVAYPVADASDALLALLANAIALTPGTMTVEVTRDPAEIWVHFLRLDDPDRARRSIARLEARCRAALAAPRSPSSASATPEGAP